MGIGIWELVVLLAIAVVLFGTKKLRTLGADLGGAIRGFRSAMNEPEPPKDTDPVIDVDDAGKKHKQPPHE